MSELEMLRKDRDHWLETAKYYEQTLTRVEQGEATFREDERQACWEDFVQVLRNALRDKSKMRDVHRRVFAQGWKDLGSGDGKPMHQLEGSAVREWLGSGRGK